MKHQAFISVFFIVFVSCSPKVSPPAEIPSSPTPQITADRHPTHEDTFTVDAWVDDPNPPQNSRVIVWGSLIKNSIHLGGMMMQATWPDETQEVGIPNCNVLVIYGSGVCVIDNVSYPSGKFVPITVTFEYGGEKYIGQTGFKPH